MEKIAIFSDIHANLTALEAVLEDINKRKVDKMICLGDLVYKGVSPAEVIDLVKAKCDVVLRGNCDAYIGKRDALEKSYWSRIKIGEDRAEYLRNLPIFHEFYLSRTFCKIIPCFTNKSSSFIQSNV